MGVASRAGLCYDEQNEVIQMFCHACGSSLVPDAKFCHQCATPRLAPSEYAIPAIPLPVSPAVPVKKGSHRVPIFIMICLVSLGLVLFFLTKDRTVPHMEQPPTVSDSPVSETPWFTNEEGTLYFDAGLYEGSQELVIPATVDGEPVTAISNDCFAGNDFITTVILPDTLTEIGDGAFAKCSAMRGIFIPEGVRYIGAGAFRDCVKLEAVCVPGSVDSIGYSAFRGCINLKFILYSGDYDAWYALYSSHIANGTQVYCDDGTYLHGVALP